MSGETIFVPDSLHLPVRNLRVFVVHCDWSTPVTERIEEAVVQLLGARDPEVRGSPFALAFSTPPFVGYGAAQDMAKGIDARVGALEPLTTVRSRLVFGQNVGQVIGGMLSAKWNMPCIDEVTLSELDFIDVGEVVPEEGFVPVVIKSLAFGV